MPGVAGKGHLMAEKSGEALTWTFESAIDLRTHQFKALLLDSNGRVNLCGGREQTYIGALQNKPNSLEHATVIYLGITKGVAGLAITRGDLLTVRSGFFIPGARAVPQTSTLSGSNAFTNPGSGIVLVAQALDTVASGGIVEMLTKGLFSVVNSN